MKSVFLTIIAGLCLNLAAAAPRWSAITSEKPLPLRQKMVLQDNQRMVFRIELEGFNTEQVETEKGSGVVVGVPGMVSMLKAGYPDLPQSSASFIVPNALKLRILSYDYTDFHGFDVVPSKGNLLRKQDPSKVAYHYGSVYDEDAFYPAAIAEIGETYVLRDFTGQTVHVFPMQYNPVERLLRVYHTINIELYTEESDGIVSTYTPKTTDREFIALYEKHFLNYDPITYPLVPEEGHMLIISHDGFMEAMEPFVAWKRMIGREATVVDVASIGSSPDEIKAFVQAFYDTHGMAYLLFVGDHQHIPCKNISPMLDHYSDSYYAYLAGDDFYQDVFVGRFSGENAAHISTQVNKTIAYERDFGTANDWLQKAIGVARNEGSGEGHYGESDAEHMELIRDSLMNNGYTVVHQEYDGNTPGFPNTTAEQLLLRINEGAGLINYCNHGYEQGWSVGGFNSGHVGQLTNTGSWPFIWAVACLNGRFFNGSCFAEEWLRATDPVSGEPTGAIAAFMATTIQSWAPPMTAQDEMVNLLIEAYENNVKRTFGGISTSGSMHMLSQHGNVGLGDHHTWVVFGDPSLTLRTTTPRPVMATYPTQLYTGANQLLIETDAEMAVVSLTMNEQLLATAYVQEGKAVLDFEPMEEAGLLTITVFGANRVTYIGEIALVPVSGPQLRLEAVILNDSIGGNANGMPDYGESVLMDIVLKNTGTEAVHQLKALLDCESPYVVIKLDSVFVGSLLPGEEILIRDAFGFELASTVPDNSLLRFFISASTGNNGWAFAYENHALAPDLSINPNYEVEDSNGNGVADPGETVILHIAVANNGGSRVENVVAGISATHPGIVLINPHFLIDSIAPSGHAMASFQVQLGDVEPGTAMVFAVDVEAGAYHANKLLVLVVSPYHEDFESGDFSQHDWFFDGHAPWEITEVDPFEGSYSAQSGALFNNRFSEMAITFESGVDDSISFHYKVSSGNRMNMLLFYVNDELRNYWSGEVPWERAAFKVRKGLNTFRWLYYRRQTSHAAENRAWIDNILLPAPVACKKPHDLQLLDAGADHIVVGWDEAGHAAAWEVWIGSSGSAPGMEGELFTNISVENFEVNGLVPNSTYAVFVRAYCLMEGHSCWEGPLTAKTTCEGLQQAAWLWPYNDTLCIYSEPVLLAGGFPEGGLYAGEGLQNGLFDPQAAGYGNHVLYYHYTDIFGCASSDSVVLTVDPCAGISINELTDYLLLYPNPANGSFTIKVRHCLPKTAVVEILDFNGNMLYREPWEAGLCEFKVEAKVLPQGVYVLRVKTEKQVAVKRLVVSK